MSLLFKNYQPYLLLLLFLTSTLTIVHSQETTESCASSFTVLEQSLLSRTENRFQLLKTFFPPRDSHPVFVTVTYDFVHNSTIEYSEEWYWSESEFYLIQPLEVFQYTSLFFANFAYRKSRITLELDQECQHVDPMYLEILTQRVSPS